MTDGDSRVGCSSPAGDQLLYHGAARASDPVQTLMSPEEPVAHCGASLRPEYRSVYLGSGEV